MKNILKNEKLTGFFTGLAYASIVLTILGQCTVGTAFYIGQGAYLVANIVNCVCNIALDRPKADKIRDFSFLGITIGLITLRALSVM